MCQQCNSDYDGSDIFVVPEYAAEIDAHLKEAELRTRPKPNYMKKQNDLTPQMRSILVDWLVEVLIDCTYICFYLYC